MSIYQLKNASKTTNFLFFVNLIFVVLFLTIETIYSETTYKKLTSNQVVK